MKFDPNDVVQIDICVGKSGGKKIYQPTLYKCTGRYKDHKGTTDDYIESFDIWQPKQHPNVPNYIRLGLTGKHRKKRWTRCVNNMQQRSAQNIDIVIRHNVSRPALG